MRPTDSRSLAQADAVALEAQLPALRHRLLRLARLSLHDAGIAEDIVQDTLIAVVEGHESRHGRATVAAWAAGILRHKIADWYRSPGFQRLRQFPDLDTPDQAIDALFAADGRHAAPVPPWPQPQDQYERQEMMSALDRCVGCLPRQTGRVFLLRDWMGFETAEICDRLGVSATNCRTILYRARMALRECMQRDWLGQRREEVRP